MRSSSTSIRHWRFARLAVDRARTILVVAAAAFIAAVNGGCAGEVANAVRSTQVTTTPPVIELLGFPDCPNTPVMRDNLTAALNAVSRGWTFTETNQEQVPEGDIRRGYPTPTILVNGRDLFGLPVPSAASMGCRIYPGGVPAADVLADKLRAAAGK